MEQARRWSASSGAQRVLPDERADIGGALDHSDLLRQLVELVDDLRVAVVKRARHVGALLEPPVEEIGRQVVLLADRLEYLVPVRQRIAHRLAEHAVELLERLRALRQALRVRYVERADEAHAE